GGITPSETPTASFSLPHGTIKEVAFLDPRQVKSIDNGFTPLDSTDPASGFKSLTGNYDLAIEQRQPLEVRATEIDLDELRQSTAPDNEYMLPNSGIIYATRDDALPDASDATLQDGSDSNARISATDFKLDPTRRVSAIRLINGKELFRTTNYREVEKGLILASNLPVYIKADADGEFNPHKNAAGPVSEFSDPAGTPFYDRATLDDNFACRSGDPRLPTGACGDPDTWRQATVISDAVTLLSRGFTDGYRSDGDYELRNNQIDNIANPDTTNDLGGEVPDVLTAKEIRDQRLANGFWDNNFVTSRNFTDQDYAQATPPAPDGNSSYFNNFVTPIQRRVEFPEFLMETCMKRVVSDCTPEDWVINASGQKARQFLGAPYPGTIEAGTTAEAASGGLIDPITGSSPYPRRVAFLRTTVYKLELSGGRPIVLGIHSGGRIACYTYAGNKTITRPGRSPIQCRPYQAGYRPRLASNNNALWFATTTTRNNPANPSGINYGYNNPLAYMNDNLSTSELPRLRLGANNGTTAQPLLVPVLQIQYPTAVSGGNLATIAEANLSKQTQWLPKAEGDSIFNLVMATGDNPSHPAFGDHEGDFNGGLPNLPRFIENWQGINTQINGSFIQIKRSSYATAPNTQLPNTTETVAPFENYPQVYTTGNNFGKTPSFEPPERTWGFDVGLLSQLPDLFAKQFTAPPAEKPNEFFREVSREDDWVKTLLCAKTLDGGNVAINDNQRPNDFCDDKTGG
ncbi:MAG: hypothetical protein F6K28_27095, partial [Microcoleus sp. SIO2G3]|nr:hypothetical protein [Microcoleus sp. SIO2G3]